ncbi:ABC transporter substrate-binding protein [Nocardioides sp. TRM66260-LWL]|uniref:ABC transporter substrate-binding protein n=1 Tax=Nocardioides sp. TRM66260-LWL TaxID=2874478 RepID=UPI001CC557B3|nr:ABC transporter substrate-binding protein [Nocardioides sp. TRM66260-LWL]MBZ5733818.1 ABC transporter substrate-binding protein [Nocardioides sp. TRM66260-LWL]
MYIGRDLANANRLFYRSLVSFPLSADPKEATTPVPDLATDTGKANADATEWSFTLRDGVTWQDGKPITCEDLKYGVSRTFAQDVITGGPNYILGYLDLPKSGYDGPYKKDGQADFDKAVTCDGNTITYKFNKPWADFPLAIASLRAFDPYRADQDKGDKSNFSVFANGPYKLQGTWDEAQGGTFVRNDAWKQDSDPLRKPLPEKIVFQQGLTDDIIGQRLIADSGDDQFAVTDIPVLPAQYSQVTGPIANRAVLVDSPFTNYLVPNFKTITDLKVRQALLASTNQEGWIAAAGGDKAAAPSKSIVNPALVGYADNPNFTYPPAGDVDAAKKLLAEAGVKTPYKITFTYRSNPTRDKGASALQNTWNQAGFDVTLNPLPDTYYADIQKPSVVGDVFWAGWGADWPSIASVIPPLFDSRINLSAETKGQDYGSYESDTVNKLIDEAASKSTVDEAAKVYAQIDDQLGKDVAYIPLQVQKFYLLRGSKVGGYQAGAATSGYPDLGTIGVTG